MDKETRFPTWPDGTPRLLKPGEYVGYEVKGAIHTPVIKYEPRRYKPFDLNVEGPLISAESLGKKEKLK